DCQTAALVSREGSIDWLCTPRFDSNACFSAILGGPENGRWLIRPAGEVKSTRRQYRNHSLILETEYETAEGSVRVIDLMPPRDESPDLVRVVEGLKGEVKMTMELVIRFDYGSLIPWMRRRDERLWAIAGPDMLRLRSDVETHGRDYKTLAEFAVTAGQRVHFNLTWFPSHMQAPSEIDLEKAVDETEEWWGEWVSRCTFEGPYRDEVIRSLMVLKGLTYAPTGGIVAAPTTSLPEQIGSVRNWDYRFCWLRDATFALYALMMSGFKEEARAWREWLLRAVAGEPSKLQIMYGLAGERRLREFTIDWLPGYEGSRPVRVGNAASKQFQLDVYGEIFDVMHLARRSGLEFEQAGWGLARSLLDFLENGWKRPDEGIWEVRGSRQHFTHSKVMAWVAFDRAIKAIEQAGLDGPIERWRRIREQIRQQVFEKGFNAEMNSFVQHYGAQHLDASLLMMPLVGFLPADDPRMKGTVKAIEKHLMRDGFVYRYNTESGVDALPSGEGAFLPCTFWLVDNYALQGRYDEATALFERLLSICNDVGLLAEEYDPCEKRQLGNFPQAFSHIALINSARNLSREGGPAHHRPEG
ncbi:MAG TPA: glycoside hydrolase family 15 protein, partial [Isosphaeraceae bacterium]|nr:glycoside hydrolase family 15 protein [Isosphaeraceae bacterium]